MSASIGYTGSFVTDTIAATGYYDISAIGGSGGSSQGANNGNSASGGLGASVSGEIYLQAGSVLEIAVGGAGEDGIASSDTVVNGTTLVGEDASGGGGGGSFVLLETNGSYIPLVVAGGGGGAGYAYEPGIADPGQDAQTGTTAGNGDGDNNAGYYGGYGDNDGTGSSGGGGGYTFGNSNTSGAGGGGGLTGDGAGGYTLNFDGSQSGDGASGGAGFGTGTAGALAGGTDEDGGNGGFGGGGASGAELDDDSGGGGGGYSGGGGGGDGGGGGGGSYLDASALNTTSAVSTTAGNGAVAITALPPLQQIITDNLQVAADEDFGVNLFPTYTATGTITGISADGITFTAPTTPVDGHYVDFAVASFNPNAAFPAPISLQSVVDAIHADTGPTPISDTFYYEVSNASGTTIDKITLDLNDVNFTPLPGNYPYVNTVGLGATNIAGIAVDTPLATGETTDAGDSLTVTISLQPLTVGASAALSINPADAGPGAGGAISATANGFVVSGSIGQINADLKGLTITGATPGDYYIYGQAVEGPATTVRNYLGEVDVECFLTGTRIRTPHGEVAVESLRAGDLVATLHSGPQPIKAIQHLGFTGAAQCRSPQIRPIRIAAGALAPNTPSRDLYVSPDHAMFLDGALVPAKLLINGTSITQPPRSTAIEYIHIELATHGIIFAENAATETYLDIGKSTAAHNLTNLDPFEPKSWEDACAPLLLAGPALTAIRTHLATRAAKFFSHQRKLPKAA